MVVYTTSLVWARLDSLISNQEGRSSYLRLNSNGVHLQVSTNLQDIHIPVLCKKTNPVIIQVSVGGRDININVQGGIQIMKN